MRGRKAQEWVVPDPRTPWWGEHRSRYHFAARFVIGRSVLDAACGSGYGCDILAAAGSRWTVGADLKRAALPRPPVAGGVSFVNCDVTRLPLASNAFDCVVSFETIEHVDEVSAMLTELRRVLRPEGRLILSTPNALVTRPEEGVPSNPYHVREYTPAELSDLLHSVFDSVTMYGQLPPRGRPNPFRAEPGRRIRHLAWRARHRLVPFGLKDPVSRLLIGRGFYPGEYEYVFLPEELEEAHVVVAVCR